MEETDAVDPKPRPNEERYFDILRRMAPQQRLDKAFELTEPSRSFTLAGQCASHPRETDAEQSRMPARRPMRRQR
ncbi:MAG: hypothetical protein AMXMBFR77_21720 [Phycisphaerales bacterium]|nr:hypothetical protein [Leptolyngbya sp.]GIK20075.1 MAG: hypothetical protein BroJett004_22390 [Planctomycetota bacterium]